MRVPSILRRPALRAAALPLAVCAALSLGLSFARPALAQAPDGGKVVVGQQDTDIGFDDVVDECPPGTCCPPSTSKKLIMGVGSVAAFLILFFLMVRLMERVFIRQEKSPLLGRHLGISLALFLGTASTGGILFAVTGCWLFGYWYLLGVVGVTWLLHLIYTLLAIRR